MGYVTSGCPKKASALLLRDPVAGNIGPGRMGSCRASLAGGVVAQPRLTHAPPPQMGLLVRSNCK